MKTESFIKKFFCFKSLIQFILLCILLFMSWSGVSAQQMKEWTVIVYMNGDNNLSPMALSNIHRMERGVHDNVNVIVLVDGSAQYSRNPTVSFGAKIHMLQKNNAPYQSIDDSPITSPLLQDLGEIDMSLPANITGFIQYAVKAAPAKHYAFIPWNHGGGWKNLLNDVDAGTGFASKPFMTIQEFARAIKDASHVLPNGRFDILMFDMCLMGQADIINEVADLADYVIASPPVKWALAPAYENLLSVFDGRHSSREIATAIVDDYIGTMNEVSRNLDGKYDSAMTAYDTSKMPALTAATRKLTAHLQSLVQSRYFEISKTLAYAGHMMKLPTDLEVGANSPWSINFSSWLHELEVSVPGIDHKIIAEVRSALSGLVVKSGTSAGAEILGGTALYFPINRANTVPEYFRTGWAAATGLGNLLESLFQYQDLNGNSSPRIENIQIGIPQLIPGRSGKSADDFNVKIQQTVKPMAKNVIKFDVVGENVLWTNMIQYTRVGNRRYKNFMVMLMDAMKDHSGNDAEESNFSYFSPVYNKGRTSFIRELDGICYKLYNGVESRDIFIVNSMTESDEDVSFGYGLYTDSMLYGRETFVKLTFDNRSKHLKSVLAIDPQTGNNISPVILQPGSQIKPRLEVMDDNGNTYYEYGQPISFSANQLFLTVDLLPDNAVTGTVFVLNTVNGAKSYAVSPEVNFVADPQQRRMKDAVTDETLRKYLFDNFYLVEYGLNGLNETLILPVFQNLAFSTANNGTSFDWALKDSDGTPVSHGKFFAVNGGVAMGMFYSPSYELKRTWYMFLDQNQYSADWYSVQTPSGVRYGLYPLRNLSAQVLEGEWKSDTEIWKFSNGHLNYERIKKGEELKKEGSYSLKGNLLVTDGARYPQFAVHVDRAAGKLYLIARDGHYSVLSRDPSTITAPVSGDKTKPDVPAPAPASGALDGVYISGADTGNARLTIRKFEGTEFYSMFLETKGQGNIVCNFSVAGNIMNATYPDGSRSEIRFTYDGRTMVLYFPNMPPLSLTRQM